MSNVTSKQVETSESSSAAPASENNLHTLEVERHLSRFAMHEPTLDLFNSLATRFNPAKMQGEERIIQFRFPDTDETVTVDVRKSVIFPRLGGSEGASTTVTLARSDFNRLLAEQASLPELIATGLATLDGSPVALQSLFGALDRPDPLFEIVEP